MSNLASNVFSSVALENAKVNTQIRDHTLPFYYGEEYYPKSLLLDYVYQLPPAIKTRKYVYQRFAREPEFSVGLHGLVKALDLIG
jgi:hypothetical protein